ncbi:DUF4329 domain-containing protein [Hoeflea prorocentri]|uniref:DUF4329 domain-containing protein n=1 Tax=Hoeflea prorocentri TaxID=1922333 RepID=A0A9X3ZFF2_9HYPH|nr:DUF4329 domain-containing protein [Hoeflea prorocentri]MCY6379602.1 DUF4329 domain-containing protein [Hoeflea prorocentri]MDA5397402.1 DUF4329 domain-containing protein [Hoeflea prorocentri]
MSIDATAQSSDGPMEEVDAFAIKHLDSIQPRSIRDRAEYCGLFFHDSQGQLAATPARKGGPDGCTPEIGPDDADIIASYHTHGAFSPEADTEVPSVDDLTADFMEGIDGYVATPGGRVWLNLLEEEITVELCGPGCIHTDPAFRPCPAFEPEAEYTIKGLVERAAEDTGEC